MSSATGRILSVSTHMRVYHVVYGTTNIKIGDALVAVAMHRYGLPSKRAAVDLALRRLVGVEMEGAGWEGDLDEIRRSRRLAG